MRGNKILNLNFLRILTLLVLIAGAAGSLYFMFNAGRNQKSIFLILLFTGWVLSPFIGFFLTNEIAKRRAPAILAMLFWLAIILTIVSLAAYSGSFKIRGTKPAFIFLIVPLISWLALIIVILTTGILSRKTNSLNSNVNL